jgi:hypothetical protein
MARLMRLKITSLAILMAILAGVSANAAEWPQEITADDGAVVTLYQPQVEVFTGNDLEARAAISVTSQETGNIPVFGAVWIRANLDIDRDTRTAVIREKPVTLRRWNSSMSRRRFCCRENRPC